MPNTVASVTPCPCGFERVEQPVPGDAAVPDDVVDPGGRGHTVHRLNVQCALDVTDAVGHAVRGDVGEELSRLERREVPVPGPVVGVLERGGVVVLAEDRHAHAPPGKAGPGRAVGAAQLLGQVPARRPGQRLAKCGGQRGIARSPAFCPAIGAVLGTSARLLCPGEIVAALLTPLSSSVETAATDSADVVITFLAGDCVPRGQDCGSASRPGPAGRSRQRVSGAKRPSTAARPRTAAATVKAAP